MMLPQKTDERIDFAQFQVSTALISAEFCLGISAAGVVDCRR